MKLNTLFAKAWMSDCIALLAGPLLTLAFAPFNIAPLAFIALILLLTTWLSATPRRALLRGFLFGLSFFGTGVYWVFNSIHTYGDASVLLSALITICFIAILATFPALVGYTLTRFFPKNNSLKIVFAFPALWVLSEWVRSWFLTGFPWLLLGYSQINTPLIGYAPVASVYGVSLAVAITSSVILNYILNRLQPNAIYRHLGFIAFIWVIGGILTYVPWTKPSAPPIKVSLVQGNIAQAIKWSADEAQHTLDTYESLSQSHWDSKMIIWPEGAITTVLQDAEVFIQHMSDEAKAHHSTLITGIPIKVENVNGYYNSIIATGTNEGVYLKRRLVPFGEFVPFKSFFNRVLDSLNIPMSEFIPGPHTPTTLLVDGINISAAICYEVAYEELAMNRNPDIGLLLTVSNDGWFGHSIAQAQHLQTAQMRAIEMRRPMLFVANSGLTAVILADGKIQSIAPPFMEFVLTDTVQPRTGKTPLQRVSLDPVLLLCIVMLFLAYRIRNLSI